MISSVSGFRPVTGTDFARGPSAAGAPSTAGAAAATGADFASVLADVAGTAVDTLKTGEASAIGGVTGTKSVQQVVTAMLDAEQALQTAITVRDKLVSAYQEISRMQI